MHQVARVWCRTEDVPAGALEDLEQLVVRADDRQLASLGVVDQRVPFRVKPHGAAEVPIVGHRGVRPAVYEFYAHGEYSLAAQVAAGPDDDSGHVVRVVP